MHTAGRSSARSGQRQPDGFRAPREVGRPGWRWRLFRIRAIIDREIYAARDWHTPRADECYRELMRLNLSEPVPGLYRNRSAHGAVRPWVD